MVQSYRKNQLQTTVVRSFRKTNFRPPWSEVFRKINFRPSWSEVSGKPTLDHHGPKFRPIEGRNDAALEYRTLSEEYLEIGERIRKRRLELHLSQEQLAEKAGISVNTLSRLECGQSSTSINKFRRILLALDADANYLIGMEVSKMKEAGGDEQVFLRFRHLEDGDQKVVAKTMRALLNALEEREK